MISICFDWFYKKSKKSKKIQDVIWELEAMNLNYSQKFFIIVFIVASTFLYAVYEKKKIESLTSYTLDRVILEMMPDFEVRNILTGETITRESVLKKDNKDVYGVLVHFWGTWCAPCEAEFPAFLKYASHFEETDVKFLLIAVNDEESKIKKFLNRFHDIPKNVVIAIDEKSLTLNDFGTVKVPETYLFGTHGIALNKFIGPQDWERGVFIDRVNHLLANQDVNKITESNVSEKQRQNVQEKSSQVKIIETH